MFLIVLPPIEAMWFAVLLVAWLICLSITAIGLVKYRVKPSSVLLFVVSGSLLFVLREACILYLDYRIRTHTVTSLWLYRLAYCAYPEFPLLVETGMASNEPLWVHCSIAVGSLIWVSPVLLVGFRRRYRS